MARSPAEIQADIAVTRRSIEHRLDDWQRRLPSRSWLPFALLGVGLLGGLAVSRLPLVRLLRLAARSASAIMLVGTVAAAVSGLFGDDADTLADGTLADVS